MAEFSFWQALLTFGFGSFFGTLLGPILLDEYRSLRRRLGWKNPRKDLLRRRLQSASGEGWVGIDKLSRLIGTDEDECRSLLIEIDARGGTLKSGAEAWALITRQPLAETKESDTA